MSQDSADDFYALAALIRPEQLSRYLNAQGWDLVDRHEGLLEEWTEPTIPNSDVDPEVHLLPINREYRDFGRRLVEFLRAVADYYEIDAIELSHRIRQGSADVLLFRISADPNSPDSVGLEEASGVLLAAHRMLTMAARYTASPGKEFAGRMRPVAGEYSRHLALGHTRRGSFIFPVLSGLGSSAGAESVFARRVVENFATGLERLRSLSDDFHSAVSDELDPLVGALARSLQPLARMPELRFVDISIRWAPGREIPHRNSVQGITLEAPSIRQIGMITPRIREILRGGYDERFARSRREGMLERPTASAAPPNELPQADRVEEVEGRIVALQIDDRRVESWGTRYSIVIRSENTYALRDVQVPVSERDYERAIEARDRGVMATATGRLSKVSSGYLLQGDVIFLGLSSR